MDSINRWYRPGNYTLVKQQQLKNKQKTNKQKQQTNKQTLKLYNGKTSLFAFSPHTAIWRWWIILKGKINFGANFKLGGIFFIWV